MKYIDFLKSKMAIAKDSGFEITVEDLNCHEFEWQKDITKLYTGFQQEC